MRSKMLAAERARRKELGLELDDDDAIVDLETGEVVKRVLLLNIATSTDYILANHVLQERLLKIRDFPVLIVALLVQKGNFAVTPN